MISIIIKPTSGTLAEDKDKAKELRLAMILPSLERDEEVVLDFELVRNATQSYIHALIGEALNRYGDAGLNKLQFKNCTPAVKSVVGLVVDYSLGGFGENDENDTALKADATVRRSG